MTSALGQDEPGTTQFAIGARVSCADGPCGVVSRVIVDPIDRSLTHVVVDPKQGHRVGRLVPVGLVRQSCAQIELGCSLAGFDNLEPAEESEFLPASGDHGGYGAAHVLFWPYYSGIGIGTGGGYGPRYDSGPHEVARDAIPPGEVAIRRGALVEVDLTRAQLGELPPVDAAHPGTSETTS